MEKNLERKFKLDYELTIGNICLKRKKIINLTSSLTYLSTVPICIRYLQIWLELPKMSNPKMFLFLIRIEKGDKYLSNLSITIAYFESDLLKGKRVVQSY